jgi:methylenetetrahydrofolate--tRNA-(uracil-5-)-methyltransferase
VRIAGQITGVEGYLESAATGLAVGLYLSLERSGVSASALPRTTALGALARHLTESKPSRFQPANINYGLFPDLEGRAKRHQRRQALAERALGALAGWCRSHEVEFHQHETVEPAESEAPREELSCAG